MRGRRLGTTRLEEEKERRGEPALPGRRGVKADVLSSAGQGEGQGRHGGRAPYISSPVREGAGPLRQEARWGTGRACAAVMESEWIPEGCWYLAAGGNCSGGETEVSVLEKRSRMPLREGRTPSYSPPPPIWMDRGLGSTSTSVC